MDRAEFERCLADGCVHHEVVGSDGVQYLAGRREPSDSTNND